MLSAAKHLLLPLENKQKADPSLRSGDIVQGLFHQRPKLTRDPSRSVQSLFASLPVALSEWPDKAVPRGLRLQ